MKPRRWLRFSLRTLFALLTLFACGLGVQVKWIEDRHEFLLLGRSRGVYAGGTCDAPRALRVLGDPGVQHLSVAQRFEMSARSLFPEAKVSIAAGWERPTAELRRLNRTNPGYYEPSRFDE